MWYNAIMTKTLQKSQTRSKPFTLGRQGFAKISAVEGLILSDAMEAEFREFDRKALTPKERRAVIAKKYGKVVR